MTTDDDPPASTERAAADAETPRQAVSGSGRPARQPSRPRDEADGRVTAAVPAGADTVECPYCGRPFRRERHRDLHRGQVHPERLTDEEIEAYRTAAESERAELRRFRLLALGALVLVYFGFLIAFAVFA